MADVPLEGLVLRLATPEGRADPYPIYHAIRAQAPVVHWQGTWFLTRHAEVSLLRDARFVISLDRDAHQASTPWQRVSRDFLLFLDPPAHTRVRSLVTSAFTPRAVEAMRTRITQIVGALLDEAEGRGHVDLIRDLAYPLPVTVICDLLGLPQEYQAPFRAWSRALAPAFGDESPDTLQAADEAVEAMTSCLRDLIARRRDEPPTDLLTAMIHASEDDSRLSVDELIANTVLLFFGGHETTVNLIGNGTLALLRHRSEWQRLVAHPAVARNAVDETLRYDPPVQYTARTAATNIDTEAGTIRAGERVNFVIGAANRDPSVFPDPDRLDIHRPEAPRHLAFGAGIHYCVGAPLAKLEAEVAFASLAARFPGMQLDSEDLAWRSTLPLRGLEKLPVCLA